MLAGIHQKLAEEGNLGQLSPTAVQTQALNSWAGQEHQKTPITDLATATAGLCALSIQCCTEGLTRICRNWKVTVWRTGAELNTAPAYSSSPLLLKQRVCIMLQSNGVSAQSGSLFNYWLIISTLQNRKPSCLSSSAELLDKLFSKNKWDFSFQW